MSFPLSVFPLVCLTVCFSLCVVLCCLLWGDLAEHTDSTASIRIGRAPVLRPFFWAAGVRDPKRHCTEFLRSFLAAYSDGSICATESRAGAAGGDAQLVEAAAACNACAFLKL